MDVGVELALGLDLGQALARQRLGQGAVHEPNAVLQLRLLVLLGSAERPLQVVEDGQELLDQPLVGARDQALLIARRPLAVVVELGLDALERVDQLLVLGPQRLGLVDLDLDLLDLLAVLDLLTALRGLRLLFVDDLVVGVLDDLVVSRRRAVAAG